MIITHKQRGIDGLVQVAANFRKTATNFHYEFNIRHLSNVFQGLLVAQPDQFKTAEKFVLLWMHESERVYGDRLVRVRTKVWIHRFQFIGHDVLPSQYRESIVDTFPTSYSEHPQLLALFHLISHRSLLHTSLLQVSTEDLGKYNALAQQQAKKLFPSFNMSKFYAAENADPLVFCHFAENIQDQIYDQVENPRLDRQQKFIIPSLKPSETVLLRVGRILAPMLDGVSSLDMFIFSCREVVTVFVVEVRPTLC